MKKGFTLIELLAVIVILAIIALIAVPIILNIVNDARETSYKRSIELYGKAVENAVANYQLYNPNNDAVGKYTTSKPLESINGLTINYEGSEVNCDAIYVYEDGNIYMEQCSVGTHPIENYTYGKAEILVTPVTTSETGNVPTGEYNPGDEYTIHIGGEDRTFFILSENSDSTKVDLIMNKNIINGIEWCSYEDYIEAGGLQADWNNNIKNDKGPVTANKYLANLTSNWEVTTKLPKLSQVFKVNNESYENIPLWLRRYSTDFSGFWMDEIDLNSTWIAHSTEGADIVGYHVTSHDTGVRPVITLRKSFLN